MIRRLVVVIASLPFLLALGELPGSALSEVPGEQVWATRYGSASHDDGAGDVGLSPDGSTLYVTGTSAGAGTADDYATVAYDASTGTQLWEQRYDGGTGRRDRAGSLDLSPDGSKVFVTGWSGSTTSKVDYATVAYDAASGAQLWVTRYTSAGRHYEFPHDIVASPDGSSVIVTGNTQVNKADFLTVAYDPSTGAELWVARYRPGWSASGLGMSPDGSVVFVTGMTNIRYRTPTTPRVTADFGTVAYDASTGVKLWSQTYDAGFGHNDYAGALDLSPDGSTLFVLGQSAGPTRQTDYATVAYDSSSGAEKWVTRYTGPHNRTDRPSGIVASPDGSAVFVTGYGYGRTDVFEYQTLAYDASTGDTLWVKRYDGRGDASAAAFDIGVSPDGAHVFVTGGRVDSDTGELSGDVDYATVAYDALTGARSWTQRYDGSSDDRDYLEFGGHALVVSPDGSRLFVTGASHGSGTRKDYATVAYSIWRAASAARNLTGSMTFDGETFPGMDNLDLGAGYLYRERGERPPMEWRGK